MTTKNDLGTPDEESRGVLDDTASIDTTSIGILGGTAQVSVDLPSDADDELDDDGVIDGEVVTLVIDEPESGADSGDGARDAPIVIEVPDAQPAALSSVDESITAPKAATAVASAATPSRAVPSVIPPSGDATAATALPETTPVPTAGSPESAPVAVVGTPTSTGQGAAVPVPSASTGQAVRPTTRAKSTPTPRIDVDAKAASAFLARSAADTETPAPRRAAALRTTTPAEGVRAAVPERSAVAAPEAATTPAIERAETVPAAKRLGELSEPSRESADLLTADRLLDPSRITKPEPEGAWSHFLYSVSGRRINIGDGRKARERKALTARIAAPLVGGARFVPVLSRKGGVGKTTITALLGMALSDAREDRVIAVDANPDRGTLADRIVRLQTSRSVRDLVRIHDQVKGYHDISAIVARDATRLDVLASDSDPKIAEAFSDDDYRDVAGVAAHYYSLVLTDTGTGIVHSVMSATLDLADQIVIVSGLSVDEARLASETLTWLENNGHADQARDAIVVLNQSNPGVPLVRLDELSAHFRTRASHVVRVPYDPQIAAGGSIVFANLRQETRLAARELAALLVEGLRAKGGA